MLFISKSSVGPGAALLAVLALASACGDGDGNDDGASGGSAGTGGTSASSGTAGSGKGGSGTGGASSGGTGTGGTSRGGSASGATGGNGGDMPTGGGETGASSEAVELRTAENFVILAKSGISTVPPSVITGDIAVSPAAASYVTGFSLSADATEEFSTSTQVTGSVYAADYASPTPSDLTTAVSDMQLAFTDAAGRAADVTELGAGDIGGMTLEPGVYQWGTGLLIPSDLTLSGDSNGVWIFQIARDLTVSSATRVVLSGGAQPENVFWQVSGRVELGTTAHFEGVVLAKTSVALHTGASINGRLLAQTAVSLDANTVVEPGN